MKSIPLPLVESSLPHPLLTVELACASSPVGREFAASPFGRALRTSPSLLGFGRDERSPHVRRAKPRIISQFV
nr:hypothetical protein Q903MT_gene218 [Picea sitchensis]